MKKAHCIGDYITIVISALLLSLSYQILVYPNEFAPSGIPGLATIVQHLFHINVGYLTMLVNIPLVIVVYLKVDRAFAIKSTVFNVIFSGLLIGFDYVDLSRFVYYTENGTSAILAPLAGGVISGFCYGIVMRRNGSTGGTDLVAALVHHKYPEQNMLWIIFGLNAVVAALSYVVYGFKLEPVILCLLYCFMSSQVSDMMLKGFKEAVKFEIVTDQPNELAKVLMEELHHGVTKLPAYGGFTSNEKTLLICVVNKRQIVAFQRILERFPGSFAYLTSVKETMGNFHRIK